MLGYILRRLGVAIVLLWLLSVITFAIYLKVPAEPGRVPRRHPALVAGSRSRRRTTSSAPTGRRSCSTCKYMERAAARRLRHLVGDDQLCVRRRSRQASRSGGWCGGPRSSRGRSCSAASSCCCSWRSRSGRSPRRGRARSSDRLTLGIAVAAISTHPLVVGLLLQLFVGNRWKLLPASGYCTVSQPSAAAVEQVRRFAPTGTPLPVRRRRAVGLAPGHAVVHVRALLRRALHADRARADAGGARGALGPHGAREGRVGVARHPRARAAERDRAGRDDGRRWTPGWRSGSRCTSRRSSACRGSAGR